MDYADKPIEMRALLLRRDILLHEAHCLLDDGGDVREVDAKIAEIDSIDVQIEASRRSLERL